MSLAGNSTSTKTLHPELQRRIKLLFAWAPHAGAKRIRVSSARRSRAQQVALYKRFLAGKNPYPVAVPGTSKHEKGLAVDIVTEPKAALHTLGKWWRSIGGTWSPTDEVHFEL